MKVLKINNNIITLNNNALASDFGDKIVYDITPQNARDFVSAAQEQYKNNPNFSIIANELNSGNYTYIESGALPTGYSTNKSGKVQLSYFDGNSIQKDNVTNYVLENISPDGGRVSFLTNDEEYTTTSNYIAPVGTVRFIESRLYANGRYYDGMEATYNARDIGGWNCDGGTVKYGKIYRSANIRTSRDITGLAKSIYIDNLGVKYEIDLRSAGTPMDDFPCANYIKFSGTAEYDIVNGTGNYDDVIKAELSEIFKAAKTAPMLIHCSMGCDRTGTLCFYIENILGMSEIDVDIEYELSSLTNDHNSSALYYVRDRLDTVTGTHWLNLKAKFDNYTGDTLSDRVINYLLSIGITADELNEFRSVMCDGTPSIIVQPEINVFNKDDPDVVVRGRFNSSHQVVVYYDGELVTGFIPCKLGDTIKLETDKSNLEPLYSGANIYTGAIQFYDSNKNFILLRTPQSGLVPIWQWSNDGKTGVMNIESDAQHVIDTVAYFRVCCAYTDIDNITITKE